MTMTGKQGFKPKIGAKILFAFLLVSIFSLGLFGFIAVSGMKGLGNYALESSASIGNRAANDSIRALTNQAETQLLALVKSQAAVSNALLEKVKAEVKITSQFASNLWQSPIPYLYGELYSQERKPADMYAVSVYTLAPGVSIGAVREELYQSGKMDEIFIAIMANDPNINTICLGTETGIFRSYPWRSGRDPSYDPRKRLWYRKAAKEKDLIWTEPYIHAATKALIITCAQPFYGKENTLAGVVEVDVTLTVMIERIMSTQIGALGYAFLMDHQGKVIARPGLTPGDTRWDETYDTENLLSSKNQQVRDVAFRMVSGETGIRKSAFGGGGIYIAYAPILGTHWSLGLVAPLEEIIAPVLETEQAITTANETALRHVEKRLDRMLAYVIGTFILTLVLAFLLANRLSKKITRPILRLHEGVKIVGSGDLDYHFDLKTGDEIEDLADAFNHMLEDLNRHIKELTETTAAKERIESELKIAHDIQINLVPMVFPAFPDRSEFDIYGILEPAKEVGGDFFDFFLMDQDRLCFVIGDVAGKGVPAALFMSSVKALIKSTTRTIKEPDRVLKIVNEEISVDNESCTFVTVFLGILNIKNGKIRYINAGHNPPLLISEGGRARFLLDNKCTAMGIDEDSSYKSSELDLKPGETIYLYTDGVTEAFNTNREKFTEKRLQQSLSSQKRGSVQEEVSFIVGEVKTFSDSMPQSDDITLLALRYLGANRKTI